MTTKKKKKMMMKMMRTTTMGEFCRVFFSHSSGINMHLTHI